MLYLIGVGLHDERDITLKGLETMQACERICIELYTSKWKGKEALEERLRKTITELKRGDMEEGMGKLLEDSRTRDVAVLVPGDPLVATTHVALFLEAKRLGVDVRVIHAPSVISAVASTGLSIYKFGKTCTLPRPQEGFAPLSFYDVILENLRVGAHTLCLLDVGDRPMTVKEAVELLEAAEKEKRKGMIGETRKAVAASFGETDVISYATLAELKRTAMPTPAVLIIPAELNDIEREMLENKAF
ncbi:MAG: diphthine synthase [Candidatus Aenigmatarchaeota archaeon]|nr:MAG: diphthine synthase [Candidatus Aenigmarchaeota archaeon]